MQVKWSDCALILAGHGSTENPDSSLPARALVNELEKRQLFREVKAAFWLEDPGYASCLEGIEADHVFIVPHFTAEGYYTKEIVPREFGLRGRVSRHPDRWIYYCDPAGLHPSMTDAILARVHELRLKAVDREICLMIAGHGTPRHRNSQAVVLSQVEKLRKRGNFGQVEAAFMEVDPLIEHWDQTSRYNNVVMVPYFMSDGLHVTEDIPQLIGVKEGQWPDPYTRAGKSIWYTRSIGTSSSMVEVILEMVRGFDPNQPFCSHCPDRV